MMMDRKMPKTGNVPYKVSKARREGEALAFVVEALEICDCDEEKARVLNHACAILSIPLGRISQGKATE